MERRKRIKWAHSDCFAVPLADGSFGLVQAIDHWLPHWIYTAVTDRRIVEILPSDSTSPRLGHVISLIAVSDDAFDFGHFTKLGYATPLAGRGDFANEQFVHNGYVGAKTYTDGILTNFLSAWHGLAPWDPYKDVAYFDKLLVPGLSRPNSVVLACDS